jgi:hypothetical protein
MLKTENGVAMEMSEEEVAQIREQAEKDVVIQLEISWQSLRTSRNRLLADSDFSQLPDAPVNRDEWATYRQALRDLPSTVDINNPVYPEQPS